MVCSLDSVAYVQSAIFHLTWPFPQLRLDIYFAVVSAALAAVLI